MVVLLLPSIIRTGVITWQIFKVCLSSATWGKCFVRYLKPTTPQKCHVFKYTSQLNLEAMDRKQVTALVLLDLSKAFDSIEHGILLRKLRELGVSIQAMERFRSYLTDRNQRVRIGCEGSDPRQVAYGVPQESILVPALFNIYINDLPAVPNLCSLKSYVDDSQLYLSIPVQETAMAVENFSEDLQRIAAWCCTHSLLINPLIASWNPADVSSCAGGFWSYATR